MKNSLTPTPKRKVGESITMSFYDALKEIGNGKKVRRLSWESESDHCLLKDGWLCIHTKGDYHTWSINDGDMEGQDWIIIKEN